MSSMVKGTQLRVEVFGYQATKSWTLPASATTNTLFTVSGGAVLVTSLIGRVTTLIGSTATTVSLGTVPTVGTGTGTTALATAVAVTSKEVGTFIGVQASSGVGGALVVGTNAGVPVFTNFDFSVNAGTITATTSANAGAGVILWYLTYIPLDNGASVA